ncbi:acetyltransferase (GNAT) family protein [Allofrancisella inopinata]|uniref:N-acetyltransferase n=1 Tax=Allofrancisella inopinata TaxID=1085647 RepID=A0AAE6YID6_9GAMM|nr:GNAT family N-acetyltransferase [Allofrancisella inopinata]QIV96520.1 N-acetyltransferase [Allofrancisella inopinata]TDT68486.1 acetyltransferase (GNAT) family protein [Allofrancisella inopinata]
MAIKTYREKSKNLRKTDIAKILTLLKKSFINDPHTREFFHPKHLKDLESNKKYDTFMLYNIHHAYSQGFVATDNQTRSIGLFAHIGKTNLSWKFHIVSSIKMLKAFGVFGIVKILKIQHQIEKSRDTKEFLHLIYLCTEEQSRGIGLAKQLIEYGYQEAKAKNIPLLLETSKKKNVAIYKKLGFSLYKQCCINKKTSLNIYFLKLTSV